MSGSGGPVLLQHPLTEDREIIRGATCKPTVHENNNPRLGTAIDMARMELKGPNGRKEAERAIVIFSAGNIEAANRPPVQRAAEAAKAEGIQILVFGLFPGEPAGGENRTQDEQFLKNQVASSPDDFKAQPQSEVTVSAGIKSDFLAMASRLTGQKKLTVNIGGERQVAPNVNLGLGSPTVSGSSASSGTFQYLWSRFAGPGTATFAAPSAASTEVSFSVAGQYVVELKVTDSLGVEGKGRAVVQVSANVVDDYLRVREMSKDNTLEVLANDVGGNSLTITSVDAGAGAYGTAAVIANGKAIRFTPKPELGGRFAPLTYTLSGGAVGNAFVFIDRANKPPVARDYTVVVNPGGVYQVPNTDLDPDDGEGFMQTGFEFDPPLFTAVISAYTQPEEGRGTVVGDQLPNGSLAVTYYAPPASSGFSGEAHFTYTARDTFGLTSTGKVTVRVDVNAGFYTYKAVNDAANLDLGAATVTIDVLQNDIGPAIVGYTLPPNGMGNVSQVDNELVYAAPQNLPSAPVSFTYRVFDSPDPKFTGTVTVGFSGRGQTITI